MEAKTPASLSTPPSPSRALEDDRGTACAKPRPPPATPPCWRPCAAITTASAMGPLVIMPMIASATLVTSCGPPGHPGAALESRPSRAPTVGAFTHLHPATPARLVRRLTEMPASPAILLAVGHGPRMSARAARADVRSPCWPPGRRQAQALSTGGPRRPARRAGGAPGRLPSRPRSACAHPQGAHGCLLEGRRRLRQPHHKMAAETETSPATSTPQTLPTAPTSPRSRGPQVSNPTPQAIPGGRVSMP